MLVAAGLGTRLDPLTRELPKPALPLANRPVAWFGCDYLARNGVTHAFVNTHHLAERLRAELSPWRPAGLELDFVHEPEILGTGGGVRNAWQPEGDEDLVVWNAKLLFAPDLGRILRVHRASGAIATLVLRALPPSSAFSPVELDATGFVRSIRGLPHPKFPGTQPYMYASVQVLSARAWNELPVRGDIIEHAYLAWLARGEPVAGVVDASPWFDVGVSPRHYLEANLALASGRVHWPGIEPLAGGVLIADGASVGARAELEQVVLGSGSVVEEGARLRRVVAWPGARLAGVLEDTIVTSSGVRVPAPAEPGR